MMDQKVHDTAERLFRSKYEKLTEQEKHVAHHITERTPISTNIVQDFSKQMTFGQKMADRSLLSGDLGSLSQYLWV
jgi:hypothetical protein